MKRKDVLQQRNSKHFISFVKNLFPEKRMSDATHQLSLDLYNAIMFGDDIGKRYRRMLNERKKR